MDVYVYECTRLDGKQPLEVVNDSLDRPAMAKPRSTADDTKHERCDFQTLTVPSNDLVLEVRTKAPFWAVGITYETYEPLLFLKSSGRS